MDGRWNAMSLVTLPRLKAGGSLELAQEFRKNAAECLKLSQKAESLAAQGYWVAMAQFWFDLAVHAEDRDAIESVDPAALPGEENGNGKRGQS
jgi:hypothetical protein